ncbi:branched-chain amino acid ABC transporter permease [Ralstonia soli]|uniref:Branched-chain amino acid ABC transporter permease n=1 Tax=Ralstonia soli TaxID=2953896 RepID=A0ABT1ADZ2_9RALS|nr:branched-chain amino acid ABC transporter permease [Ralstonia soli]MCO5396620.1 branched-chain amino acid ABC transporter permease [Ralstonia soli]
MMKITVPIVIALAAAPLYLAGFQLTLLTEILIFALFAMSLDLQMGYARMFSFGHVAPYGAGAYIAAFAMMHGCSLPWAILLSLVIVTILAVPIGWLCTRASGVAFAMLTLAIGQLTFAIVFKWDKVTGGSDGLSGFVRNPGPLGLEGFASREGFYWLALGITVALFLLAREFVRSPLGTAIVGARESEQRAVAIGYRPRSLRVVAFVASNALAGIAGALHAGFLLFVSPEILHWSLSGHVIIAVILGGTGTLIGPMIGAALFVLAHHELSAVTDSWPLVMGLLFIFIVIAAPQGLWGFKATIESKLSARKSNRFGAKNATS